MNKSVVSITCCPDYKRDAVRQAVEKAIGVLPGTDALFSTGTTVLLKPNLLSASQPPENAVNTHHAIIRGVADYCIKRGCRVLIGDSCGSLSPGSTRRALEVSQAVEAAGESGADIVNFDTAPFRKVAVAGGKVLEEVNIAGAVLDADVVITLPKLKTHGLTLLTGAVKNQFGTVPGRHKKEIHIRAPKPAKLSEAVVDVFSAARPHLAVMDATVAMEGNGPAGGRPREVGLMLSSCDPVALDAVAGAIIGYRPDQIATTTFAAARGLGNGQLKNIQVRGLPLERVRVTDFRRPSAGRRKLLWHIVPSSLSRYLIGNFGNSHPVILHERCTRCRECIVNCPAGALEMQEGRVSFRSKRCIGCYCCSEACPRAAIEFRSRGLSRIVPFG